MTDEQRYTLAEASRELAAQQCMVLGHDLAIGYHEGRWRQPESLHCRRCYAEWDVLPSRNGNDGDEVGVPQPARPSRYSGLQSEAESLQAAFTALVLHHGGKVRIPMARVMQVMEARCWLVAWPVTSDYLEYEAYFQPAQPTPGPERPEGT